MYCSCPMVRIIKSISNITIASCRSVNGSTHRSLYITYPSYSVSGGISVRNCNTTESKNDQPFYKKLFGSKDQAKLKHEMELEDKINDEEKILREIEADEREAKIKRRQNRSKLHFSHRNILKGEPPQVGLHMHFDETHMTRAYKAQLLGQYGRSKTGIDPSICWPTSEEMADEHEKERVFYDNKSLLEILEEDRIKQKQELEAIKLR